MSLPLSEALDLKKQPASELGGEFTLSARKGERDDASAIAGAQADPDDLPLFFDPRLAAPSGESPCPQGGWTSVRPRPSAAVREDWATRLTRRRPSARSKGASRAARGNSSS